MNTAGAALTTPRGPALRGRWLFRMNSRTRQSQTVPHCVDVSLAVSFRPVSLLREILTAVSSRPRRPTPHTDGRVQYSIHDVFVDTHGSRTPLAPATDDQTRTTAKRPSLKFLTSTPSRAPRGVCASVCSHHCLCHPFNFAPYRPRFLTPRCMGQRPRWLQAAEAISRWWFGCGRSTAEVSGGLETDSEIRG